MKNLFPFKKVREEQKKLLQDVQKVLQEKKNLIANAPTGLGKTVSTIAPALSYALENKKTIFFLTNRHTQHKIAIETLGKIKEKFNLDFVAVDLIGKRQICLQPKIEKLSSQDLNEYCNSLRDDDLCEFYQNIKDKKINQPFKKLKMELIKKGINTTREVKEICQEKDCCPYFCSIKLAKEADIIITDYYYIFNPSIRKNFLKSIDKELEDCLLIVDEAHNLPSRIRRLMTTKLSNYVLLQSIKEAKKFGFHKIIPILSGIQDFIKNKNQDQEKKISQDNFFHAVNRLYTYEDLVEELHQKAKDIEKDKKKSFLSHVANFLENWNQDEEGFVRYITQQKGKYMTIISLNNSCLDPSLITQEVFDNVPTSILMSATLSPTKMYKEILGLKNCLEENYNNPFPKKNRLNLIIPGITTKYTQRSEQMYKKIASLCSELSSLIPGNMALFFPSYQIRDKIHSLIDTKKDIILEESSMTKKEKINLLNQLQSNLHQDSLLLAVTSANFAEGIDLPNVLNAVGVVGLPLAKPDLETKELITYYNKKFGQGWNYGYIFPAVNKMLQAAGRCIRSESDRGIILLMDTRYTWPNYKRCLPDEWNIKTQHYREQIKDFFS